MNRPKHNHDASPTSVVDGVTSNCGAPGLPGIELPFDTKEATKDSSSLRDAKCDNEHLNKASSGRSLMSFGFQSTGSGLTSWVSQKLRNSSFRSGMSWSLNSAFSFTKPPPVKTEQQQEPVQPIGLCVSIEQERGDLMENNRILSAATLDSQLEREIGPYTATGCENLDFSMLSLDIGESNRAMEIEVDVGANILAPTTAPCSVDTNENQAKEPVVENGVTSVSYADADVLCGQGGEGNNHPGNKSYIAKAKTLQSRYQASSSNSEKKELVLELIGFVRERGGRFLKKDSTNRKLWTEIDYKDAHDKASRLLRGDRRRGTKTNCAD